MKNYKEELLETTVELMKIPSVKEPAAGEGKPFGEPIAQALEFMLAKAGEIGFKTENFSGYAGHIEYGEGEEILGILCHLDVVPAGDNWSVAPFDGITRDGKLYGRGAIDNKGPAVAVLYALAALKDSGWQPKRRIRLILGTDEESGWECMNHYMQVAAKPNIGFAPDADFPVINNEKGILMVELSGPLPQPDTMALLSIAGGNRPNMVPDRCSVKLAGLADETKITKIATEIGARLEREQRGEELTLTFKGVSAHGSTPESGDNAVSYALALLDRLGLQDGLTGVLQDQLGFACDGRGLDIELRDESGALSVNLGVINTDSGNVTAQLDIRYPVTYTETYVLDRIRKALPEEISLTKLTGIAPLHVDADSELIQILQRVYEKHTGKEAKLISIGGGTYARALDNAVAFGPVFPGQPELAHQRDEFIEFTHLVKLMEIYGDAIYMLGNKGGV